MFQNHETIKIFDEYVFLFSIVVYTVLFLLTLNNFKSYKKERFLSRDVTEQLRGIGISLVVIGHIGVHILGSKENFLIFSSFGVSLFFVLSGYGLTRSYLEKKILLKEFILNRINRVMVPYWFATFLILVLDFFLLNRKYDLLTILLTILGINIFLKAQQIDYVRWFITVLLIWYSIFLILWPRFNPLRRIIYFGMIGLFFLFVSYYELPLGYAFLSFPFGVLIGLYYKKIENRLNSILSNTLFITSLATIFISFSLSKYLSPALRAIIPNFGIAVGNEILYITFSFALMIFVSLMGHNSILTFIGKYSYEIFLFHGVFMVKYDFVLFKGPLILSFWPFGLFIILLAGFMQKMISKAKNRF